VKLLEVAELTKKFGGLVACESVSLRVKEREIVGLIGPNGAGKTTFFNCVAGFLQLTSGTISFNGERVDGLDAPTRAKKGIVKTFQLVQTLKEMTVLENVMMGAFCRTPSVATANKEGKAVLEFVGLADKRDMLGAALTIADQKRLEVARALATKPKLLLLDEAVAGLTPTEAQAALEMIRKIRDSGITIIMVEHVMEAVMTVSDRVVVLASGKKIAEGFPQEVSRNEDVIRAYLGERYNARSQ
jgi:branched-chain amino acid transport system ATP-binding protein